MPTERVPWLTAAKAYSIWTSLPDGENVVSEKLYRSAIYSVTTIMMTVIGSVQGVNYNFMYF